MLNSRTQLSIKPQTLTADTAYFNGQSTQRAATPLDVVGIPTICISLGALGASTSSISVMAISTTMIGVTGTAVKIGGEDSIALTPVDGALRKIRVDNPLPEGQGLIVGVTSFGDTAVASVTVVSETPNSGVSDGR